MTICPCCDHEDDVDHDRWVLAQVTGLTSILHAVGRDLTWLRDLAESTGDERLTKLADVIERVRKVS